MSFAGRASPLGRLRTAADAGPATHCQKILRCSPQGLLDVRSGSMDLSGGRCGRLQDRVISVAPRPGQPRGRGGAGLLSDGLRGEFPRSAWRVSQRRQQGHRVPLIRQVISKMNRCTKVRFG